MLIKKADLTTGKITPAIFGFCIPTILGSLLQVMFNMADQIVLGQMAGSNAVASVGACTVVVALIVNFCIGISGGASVILARAAGAKDDEQAKKIISTAMIMSLAIGVIASAIAVPLAAPFLRLTNCPDTCYDGALIYLRIYYSSIPAIIVYNFGSAILRVLGDTKRPTIYLTIAGLLNVSLNIILCFSLTQKVAAVAIATMASQLLGSILVVRRLITMKESYRLEPKKLNFDFHIFCKILKYGVPTGINTSLFCIANLQIQSGINSFGDAATCGNSSSASIEGILAAVCSGFDHTMLAMVGQNVGAEKPERVKKAFALTLIYNVAITGVLSMIVFTFREPLLSLYAPDSAAAVAYGSIRMHYVTAIYAINAVNGCLAAMLNAFGFSFIPMCSSIITTIVFRTIWMQFVYPNFGTFDCIMFCFSVSWMMTLVILSIMSVIIFNRYNHGKLKKI